MTAEDHRRLAELAGATPPRDIPEVLDRLEAIEKYATATSRRGAEDGIASFTTLYRTITSTIDDLDVRQEFHAPQHFLARLDVAFAQRYFAALRCWAESPDDTPQCWRVLFAHREDPDIPKVNFAAAGVNAHINFDLSAALLRTWEELDPYGDHRALQRRDYDVINEVFATEMDGLRERMHSFLSRGHDGAVWDRGANWAGDAVVRWTRHLAWDEASEVWDDGNRATAVARSDERRGGFAGTLGAIILKLPLPV